ncbi:sugar transferase [bacterium]|nr:MAG: sugar transferase [bacterium]
MIKRSLDIVASLGGIVLLAPLFGAVALAVKLTSGGPVFYRQVRLGRHGRPFRILKFRSMVDGAESRGTRVTRSGDERVTSVGRFLRRHKIDELPQLFNVLRGDMSLVGPRPEVPEFAAHYPEEFCRLLIVRPGITHRATQLFRQEEDILGKAQDPHRFYVEKILPRKLAIYLADLDRTTLVDDLRTILGTVFDSGTSIEIELLSNDVARADAATPAETWLTTIGGEAAPPRRERSVSSSLL